MSKEKFIDLSHTIENGMITYKGLPAPIICDYLSREDSKKVYAEGTEFQIAKIEMVSNTGTYIDVPFHRYAHGKDLSEMVLENLVDVEGVLVQLEEKCQNHSNFPIGKEFFEGLELEGKAVLVHTGWDRNWNTEKYYENYPFLTEEAALFLVEENIKLVGIDSHNIDDTRKNTRPVHSHLLHAEIPIVEHMTQLKEIPIGIPFTFTALPPKFKGVGTFAIRAMAKIHSSAS